MSLNGVGGCSDRRAPALDASSHRLQRYAAVTRWR